MTVCRCGADIRWVDTPAGRVPIESHLGLTSGPDRYNVVEFGERWRAEPLDPNSRASGHPDHRPRCPRV
jgi:hypothetical protein